MDNKKFSFLITGIFALVLIGTFVIADSYDVAPSTAKAGETVSLLKFNVSLANTTAPAINNNLTALTIDIIGTATYTNITSVNVSDGTNDFSNNSLVSSNVTIDVTNAQIEEDTNFTINFTLNSSADYAVTIGAKVTTLTGEANITTTSTPFNSSSLNTTESTAPTATATCSPSQVSRGGSFPCTCTGTDSGAAASGVATSTGSSDSPEGISAPITTGTFTYTCTVTDHAGNSKTNTAQYTILGSGGAVLGGGTTQPQSKHTIAKITPGVVSIAKNFDPEIGVKEIRIEVNNEVQNVKITVTKHDGKPAEISVEKSGDVYQYFEINAENLGNNLDKATVKTKVEKQWVMDNNIERQNVIVYRFNEETEEWEELNTNYAEEDDTYYYYDIELDSFSYFAIGEKTLVESGKDKVGDTIGKIKEGDRTVIWVVVLAAVAILVALVYYARRKR